MKIALAMDMFLLGNECCPAQVRLTEDWHEGSGCAIALLHVTTAGHNHNKMNASLSMDL